MNVEQRLRQVFADVFGVDADSLTGDASPNTILSWDSVAHLTLMFALEAEFNIEVEPEEIPELVSFQSIRERVTSSTRAVR